jgi:hypothetical protein
MQRELERWAHKAAKELAGHTGLVDWRAKSKRLNEQIEGRDAIGYEWAFWHRQQDEGKAAQERIASLLEEYHKITK